MLATLASPEDSFKIQLLPHTLYKLDNHDQIDAVLFVRVNKSQKLRAESVPLLETKQSNWANPKSGTTVPK